MKETDNAANDVEEMYLVVRNYEEQYSIWRSDRELPSGWESVGDAGPKSQCLEWIRTNWTDMRPASLRGESGETLPTYSPPSRQSTVKSS
jgi:MbtH protein